MSEQKQTASLGCGTLILIALIVLIFSNQSDKVLQNQVRALDEKLTLIMNHLEISDASPGETNLPPENGHAHELNKQE